MLAACGSINPGGGAPLAPPQYTAPLACAGKAAAGLADHLLIGFAGEDATASKPGFDIRYQYLAGGLTVDVSCQCGAGCAAGWWGCWQENTLPPGQFVKRFVAEAEARGLLPMFTYYEILQSSGVSEGIPEATVAARDQGFMARYFADFRFFLQQIGDHRALVHIEPDFWGYAQRAAIQANSAPDQLMARVAAANPTDCGGQGDTLAGMGRCLVAMVRKYAPSAQVGLHASAWATGYDAI
jgi:hypothetical protein